MNYYNENIARQIYNIIKNKVSKRNLEVFELRFVNKLTFKEIGMLYGISKERARQICMKIIKKIKKTGMVNPCH